MTPTQRELLQGMSNCYTACGDDFENTVWMVARARELTADDVKRMLAEMKEKYSNDPEYLDLRKNLPSDFPL